MRITGQDPFIIDVPDAAVTSPGPSPTVDLGALDGAEALALAEAASAVTNTLPTSQITWVRTAADLPAAVAGVRTLLDNHQYYVCADVNIGTDRLASADRTSIIGIGAAQSSLRTSNASPLLTARRLVLRDILLLNSAGPCARVAGTVPEDIGGILRADGCGFVGNSASGVIQAHDLDLVAVQTCRWQNCTGVGIRPTGTVRTLYAGTCISQGNAAGFKWMQVPASPTCTISGRVIASNLSCDLANGGVAIDADASALPEQGLTVEDCGFPAAATPGVGAPVVGIAADDPKAYFSGNVNLENTQLRGALAVASNATATVIGNTTDFFALAGTTTLQESAGFDSPAAGDLRWTGAGPLRARMSAFVSLSTGSPNQDLQLAFAVTPTSGPVVLLPFRQEDITDGTTLRTGNMAIMGWATLAPGDVVDLRVRNRTAANNVTWIHGQVLVEQVGN